MAKQSKVGVLYKSPRGSSIFATVIRFLVVLQILFLTTGCVHNPSATFRNPKFSCPSSDIVESGKGYPFPVQVYPTELRERSVAELKDFCARMKQRFANSHITVKEARHFSLLLEKFNGKTLPDGNVLYFYNGFYGMPGPERPKPFIFDEQVMLRKLTDEKSEVFYYYIGPGRNYVYEEVYLKDGGIAQVTVVEAWREDVPG